MTKHRIFAFLVAFLSAGWLVPLWLAVSTYLSFWRAEGWPLLQGKNPANSFPYLDFAQDCVLVSAVWLGVVVFFWAYIGYTAFVRRRAA
jgi:hypothetical protein